MKRQTIYSAKVRRAVICVISGVLWTVGGAYAAGPLTAAPPAHSEPAHAEQAHSESAPSNNTAQPAAVNRPSAGVQANSPNASPANLRGNEGDRRNSERNNRNDRNNGTLYGDPWWPYAYGWGDDWDGNDNTGTFVQPTYTNTDNNTAPAAAPPSSVQSSPQSSPSTPSAAANAAILANAVNKSPEMVAANNAVQLAQVAYDTERERVVAEVAKTPEYQQALARKHDAAKDLRTVKESDKGQPAVVDAATAKMDASDEVTKMREQAVATDANAVTAKTKLAEAVAEREAVRAKLMSQLGQH